MKNAKFYYKNVLAPKPNKPNHIGVSVIIQYDHRILLEHRVDSNRWAIIGGGLNIDEDLVSCAIREVFEETGLSLDKNELRFYKIYDDPSRIAHYPDGNILRVITVVYHIKLLKFPILKTSLESKELKFFSKEEIMHIKIAETHIPIIQEYYDF
jgi:8-oxo-dGTP pyrophosphatase MutT (NUDIX family)